jgi:hypothetical protein
MENSTMTPPAMYNGRYAILGKKKKKKKTLPQAAFVCFILKKKRAQMDLLW